MVLNTSDTCLTAQSIARNGHIGFEIKFVLNEMHI